MNKIFNSVRALILFIRHVKVLDPTIIFYNKKVAVIGPADSAYIDEKEDFINGFDYVIRINKALYSWETKEAKYIGRKTDIWYHSFFENLNSGGGPISTDLIKKFDVSYLINPRTGFESYRRTFNFYKKYNCKQDVYHYPFFFYRNLLKRFKDGLKPTIGLTSLYGGLLSECKELYITGFTFFKTPYACGYRDHLVDMDKNREHFRKQGIHDSELEFQIFLKLLENAKCKKIVLDAKLASIINQEKNHL